MYIAMRNNVATLGFDHGIILSSIYASELNNILTRETCRNIFDKHGCKLESFLDYATDMWLVQILRRIGFPNF